MTAPAALNFQGVPVDPRGVNPMDFFRLTRRRRATEFSRAYAGLGNVENCPVRKSDILTTVKVRFSGNIAVTGNTVNTTSQWPHNLLKNAKVNANGQTNLIDVDGLALKVREFINNPDLTDRGIIRSVNGVNVQSGTLSKATENWGVGMNQTAIAIGNYPVELEWTIPIAEDDKDLTGALFLQTASTDIQVNLQWANQNELFSGAGVVTLTGNVIVETEKFSIPTANGMMIVPDLSLFHALIQTPTQALNNGENQIRLNGQGSGKQLLRLWYRITNGATPAPLAATAANYGPQSWGYGTSERPETYFDGLSMRLENEHTYGNDIGGVWGNLCHEFASANAFRDTIDMGSTSELRAIVTIQNAVGLVNPVLQYTQETVFSAGG